MNLGTLLSAMIAIAAVVFTLELTGQTSFVASSLTVLVLAAFFSVSAFVLHIRPYRKRILQLDTLLTKVSNGESVGSLNELLKKK